MKKILFFDVDGTLVDFTGTIPVSTKEALLKARERGHRLFICTGRSKCQIAPDLLQMGFDGIVAASGAYVECDGKEVFHHYMPEDDVRSVIDFCREHNLFFSCQSKDDVFMERNSKESFLLMLKDKYGLTDEQFAKMPLMGNSSENIEENYDCIEKIIYHGSSIPVSEVSRLLGKGFDVTMTSFEEPDDSSGEITSAGIHKAYGMQKALDYYGLEQKDSIAFGDGPNDFEMINFAGLGVAMGNAVTLLKDEADMVTDSIREDGILHALERLELI